MHARKSLLGWLLNLGFVKEEELRQKFREEKTSLDYPQFRWLTDDDPSERASLYNANINSSRVTGLSIEKTELPVTLPQRLEDPVSWYQETLKTMTKILKKNALSLASY